MPKRSNKRKAVTSPDYSMWTSMAIWKRAEAIALALELDPDLGLIDENGNGAVAPLMEKTRRILQRAFEAGAFSNPIQVTPREFLSWLKSNRIDAPRLLLAAAAERGHDIKDWRNECERLKIELHAAKANRPDQKNRSKPIPSEKTLYTIILGVAYGRHGFDPSSKRNKATAAIKSEVGQAGLTIDEDAILNALRTAVEVLDFEPPQSDR